LPPDLKSIRKRRYPHVDAVSSAPWALERLFNDLGPIAHDELLLYLHGDPYDGDELRAIEWFCARTIAFQELFGRGVTPP